MRNNNFLSRFKWIPLVMIAVVLCFSSCEDNFDEPPGPEVNVNADIKMLKDLYVGTPVEITEAWDIEST